MDQSTETSAVPFGVEKMSKFIYDVLCNDQSREHAFGQDGPGNSLEINWSHTHEEWQFISRVDYKTDVEYKGLWEESFVYEDPEILYDIIRNWNMVEDLEEILEIEEEERLAANEDEEVERIEEELTLTALWNQRIAAKAAAE